MVIMIFINNKNNNTNDNTNDKDSDNDSGNGVDRNWRKRRITMKSFRLWISDIIQHKTLNQRNHANMLVNIHHYKRGHAHDHKTL